MPVNTNVSPQLMIGVQAVSGGLIGLILIAILALIGCGALVGGGVLVFRGRRVAGILRASVGAALLIVIRIVVAPIFPSSVERHVVDLRPAFHLGLRDAPAQCVPVGREEWCSVSKKVRNLLTVLPDGGRRSFGATSLHAVFSGNELKKLAFMVGPSPDGTQLISLLTSESKAAGGGAAPTGAEEALRRILSNEVVPQEQHALFAHAGYRIHVWILPRHSAQDTYGVWYEILGQAPGVAISSSANNDRSNRSFEADVQSAGFTGLLFAGQLRRWTAYRALCFVLGP